MTQTSDVATGAAIRLSGLRKHYGAVRAVDGIDLVIAPGEVVALLGPNGAGKSTTIDMLLGLTRPDAGEITVFGRSARSAVTGGMVGAMLQSGGFVDDMTAGEIVRLMGALYSSSLPAEDALNRAGVLDIAKQRYGRLSGGQKQRVRFAAAIVCEPDLLVLDEPTVGMDVEARREFWAAMRAFTDSGHTVLFATHYLAEAQDYADRVVLLRHGLVVADGTVAEVRATVTGRVITAVLPDVDVGELNALPGVSEGERLAERIRLRCADSDAALRALLAGYPDAREIEVTAQGLEEAFLALTSDEGDKPEGTG